MDATTAGLVGAAIGAGGAAVSALIGGALSIGWESRRHRRDLAEARRAGLLEKRLAAHQELMEGLLRIHRWAVTENDPFAPGEDWREPSGDSSPDHVRAALPAVQLLSSEKVSELAREAVELAGTIHLVFQFDDSEDGSRRGGVTAGLGRLIDAYRLGVKEEIGAVNAH
ncbi:hypothetical protein [Kineosporia succinea]|uniref:Uncharacterized protein n=1 Tax=Kineosporia succinea TaxID=84632 RepID=A0ABT9NXQ3_9ACTN|nr:hypothetical protein [Kineosporia succinea]MDP9825208.1 hypothetical protein [Kineosporia succinea]